MNNNRLNTIFYSSLIVLWVYCLISAVMRPILNDCVVFWTWAQQVNMSPLSGMDAIESVWEIKGLLSRLFYYQLYLLTNIFTNQLYPNGQYIYNAIGFTEISCIVLIAIAIIPENFLDKRSKMTMFFVSTAAIYTMTPMASLQPEILGFALISVSFALLLRNTLASKIVGGVLLGLTFFCKDTYPFAFW